MYLDELTSKEFKRRVGPKSVVIWPIGAVEEHGPHLPLNTDSVQPEWVAREVAKMTGALIAPPFRFGNCGATSKFPGTISLSFDALRAVAYDVVSELARNGFKRIVVLSGHAGRLHMAALRAAAEKVVAEKDVKIMVLSDYDIAYAMKDPDIPADDGHAGMIETSRTMAIVPKLVKAGKPKAFSPKFPPYQVLRDHSPYFPEGYHGDPRKASAGKGREFNRFIAKELARLVKEM